jgi:hypothetical protein
MPFDIDASGNVPVTPLVSYESAIIADTGCALRLILARPADRLGTGSIVVQMAMSVVQAQQLVQDIQEMIDRILSIPVPDKKN